MATGDTDTPFRFAYDPPRIGYGRGRVDSLEAELEEAGADRALVVCGSTVGETPAVIDPVRAGLGDRLAGVFAGTTPQKRLDTAYEALAAMRAADADALVGLGGGSSLDVATVAAALAATDRSREAVGREFAASGRVPLDGDPPPLFAVPTTLAGAGLSAGAGITATPASWPVDAPTSGGVSAPALMPTAAVYDPDLFATTPWSVLSASAMNGFDKALETPYARAATPITDATAGRALAILSGSLPALGRDPEDGDALAATVRGVVLAQYGISRPGESTLSVIHAFGHALRDYGVQQGAAHAAVAPQVLEALFASVDGRRALLAASLGVADAPDPARAVVDRVAELRDALGLPSRLRDLDGPAREDLPDAAAAVLEDGLMENAPPGFDPTVEDVLGVLEAAW